MASGKEQGGLSELIKKGVALLVGKDMSTYDAIQFYLHNRNNEELTEMCGKIYEVYGMAGLGVLRIEAEAYNVKPPQVVKAVVRAEGELEPKKETLVESVAADILIINTSLLRIFSKCLQHI